MDPERIFPNWIKRNLTVLKEGEDPDHLYIECELVRTMGEARKKVISNIKLSDDFQAKLLDKLNKTESETCNRWELILKFLSARRPRNYIFATVLVVFMFSILAFSSQNNYIRPISAVAESPIRMDIENELSSTNLESILRNSKNQTEILKQLINHYKNSGNHEKANMIHAVLEMENIGIQK